MSGDHVDQVDAQKMEELRRIALQHSVNDQERVWVATQPDAAILDMYDKSYPGGAARFIKDNL